MITRAPSETALPLLPVEISTAVTTMGGVAGRQAIANGADQVAVVFDVPFDVAPVIAGLEVVAADSNDADLTSWGAKNLTRFGFTGRLSGAAPNANYVLHWEAQEATEIGGGEVSLIAYYGKSSLSGSDMDSSAEIIAALSDSDIVTSNDSTLDYVSSAPTPKFLYYAYPAVLGALTSAIIDSFESIGDFGPPATVDFGGFDYLVYRSTNALQSAVTVQFS